MRLLLICILSCCNILIFGFIGLNYPAFQTVIAYKILQAEQLHQEVPPQMSPPSQAPMPSKTLSLPKDKQLQKSWKGKLSIPRLNISVSVEYQPNLSLNDAKTLLENGTMSLTPFQKPDQEGTTIIFGHSSDYSWNNNTYGDIFALLPQLSTDDEIILSYNAQSYHYSIQETLITSPSLEGIQTDAPQNQLVLSTCYPIGFFNKRFNVIATPAEH